MKRILEPYAWRDVALAVLPNSVWLAAQLVISANEAWWEYIWLDDVLALLACAAVIAVVLRREHRLTLWSLPACSLGMGSILSTIQVALRTAIPTFERDAVGRTVLDTMILLMVAGTLLIGIWAARQWGGAASLAVSGIVGQLTVGIMDPTYGLLIIAPETYSPLGVAALDLIPQGLFLIALPVAALRARSIRGQIGGLLGAYAASLLSMILISVAHDFALQGVRGARPLGEELLYTFTVGPLYAGGFWLILAAITFIYHAMQRAEPEPPPEEASLTPGMAA